MSIENPTAEDIVKLTEALKKERNDHAEATKALKVATARVAELEALDPSANPSQVLEQIKAAVAAGVAVKSAELQARVAELEATTTAKDAELTTVKGTLTQRTVEMQVREACHQHKVKSESIADLLTFATIDGLTLNEQGEVATKDGADIAAWIDSQKAAHPWAWPVARGTGARGDSGGPLGLSDNSRNPFKQGEHFSLTEQSQLVLSNPGRAMELASQAGVPLNLTGTKR